MPEAIEIEILKEEIFNILSGKKVKYAFLNKTSLSNVNSTQFNAHLMGKKLIGTRRIGKVLIIDFSTSISLLIHFLLTGYLKLENEEEAKNRQAGIVLEDGITLTFNGIMIGGFIKVCISSLVLNDPVIKNLGPDVLSEYLNINLFSEIIKANGKFLIKEVLIDQSKIAGLGNAYSDEILFQAQVHPKRKCNSLKTEEIGKILNSIRKVLNEAKSFGGASELSFIHLDGTRGSFHEHFKVHKREGKKCYTCNNFIKMEKIKGRSTYFCPTCQK